jgi:ABC-2 type transport system permease protein
VSWPPSASAWASLSTGDAATVALTDDGVLSAVLGMAGYITAIALLGLGLGILLRSVASGIGILVAGVLVLPALAGALLPASLDSVLQYLPTSAAAPVRVRVSPFAGCAGTARGVWARA